MDYIRETIDTLKRYQDYLMAMINLKEEITKLETELEGKGIAYSDMPKGNFFDNDEVIVNKICRIHEAKKELAMSTYEIRRVDRILNDLSNSDDSKDFEIILRRSFIEHNKNNDTERIADEIGYSRRQFYRLRNQAVKTMAIHLFGARANR